MSFVIKNQAVKLYSKNEPLFNDNDGRKRWHHDYFNLVTCDDTTEIIVDNSASVENDITVNGTFSNIVEGENTSVFPSKLRDNTATFITDGVQIGMFVTGNYALQAKVTNVDSETELTLDNDIFTFIDTHYVVSDWKNEGATFVDNTAKNHDPSVGFFVEQQLLTIGKTYKIIFDVVDIVSLTNTTSLYVSIGDTTTLILESNEIEAKTYTTFGIADTNNARITFAHDINDNAQISIDNVQIIEIKTPLFFIVNCNDDSIEYVSDINDLGVSGLSSQIKLIFDWSNVFGGYNGYECVNGCFYMGIIESISETFFENRINNGTFEDASDWIFGIGWSLVSNTARVAGGGTLSQTNLLNNFEIGYSYNINFEISAHLVGELEVKLFSNSVEILSFGGFNDNGIFNIFTGILEDEIDEIRFIGFSSPNPGFAGFSLDNISAFVNTDALDFDYRTDCFSLCESHESTIKLEGRNFDNAFGIDFKGLDYSPSLRITAELLPSKYEGEIENEENSAGISKTLYFKSENVRELFIWQQPEHIHSFLRLLIGYDLLKIDGIEYISKNPAYSIDFDRISGKIPDLLNSTVELRLKDDLNENRFC